MNKHVWDRFHQMPSGREFEIYHYAEDVRFAEEIRRELAARNDP